MVSIIIASNKNDGIAVRESGGLIGLVNQGNTFRNNGRGGIGIYDGTTRNMEIAYNTIHNNKRGIGATAFDGTMFTIANNVIYSNTGTSAVTGGGIGFCDMPGSAIITGNKIYGNSDMATGGVGGIRAKNATGTISIANNYIAGNMGVVGGIGITISNGTFSFINNQIMNNIGSSTDVGLMNVGGVGFNNAGVSASIFFSGNTLENNRATVPGGPGRGRVGAFGISNSNASISFVNNTIANNDALCIGGAGFDAFGGTAFVSSNIIYSNTNSRSSWGAGGLVFDEASGSITISNNTIYNNTNTATGRLCHNQHLAW